MFDVANELKKNDFIDDAIVLNMPTVDNDNSLVAHIVWSETANENSIKEYIDKMNSQMQSYLPEGVKLVAYAEHDVMLPYSPTTLKKDKNRLSKQYDGYIQSNEDGLVNMEFAPNEDCKYEVKTVPIESQKHRK